MGILKSDWERYREPAVISIDEVRALTSVVCKDTITDLELLQTGCANTNYKISFASNSPIVLRLYTREVAALSREMHIYRLLEDCIPIARMLYADASQKHIPYSFAFFSYVDGILFRDVILKGDEEAIKLCSFEVGRHLAALNAFTFPEGGFFDEHFHVQPFKQNEAYLDFMVRLLKDPAVKRDLGAELHGRIHQFIVDNKQLLLLPKAATLTHGDFDPSNIKVVQKNGAWCVSGILDWEFAFAGSSLVDVGTMLRYSHKVPPCYEESFISGLNASCMELPPLWKKTAKMLDTLRLLHIIHSNPKARRPKINDDAINLIIYTLDNWKGI